MASDGTKLKVLVIDDDDIARELLSSVLEKFYKVFELSTSIGASRVVSQQGIDAVVLDVMMPGINGDKLAKLLRKNARGDQLAIVLVSSRPLAELEELGESADVDAVVEKREIRTQLAMAVRSACRSRMAPVSSR